MNKMHPVTELCRFDRYVLLDHKERWRKDSICMLIAWGCYLVGSYAFSLSEMRAIEEAAGVLFAGMTATTIWYSLRSPTRKSFPIGIVFTRRRLIIDSVASLGAIFLVASPALEAALLDQRLRRTLEGPLDTGKLKQATRLVQRAQKFNVRVDPGILGHYGAKVLRAGAERPELATSALAAAAEFATYRSCLATPLRLNFEAQIRILHVDNESVVADMYLIGPEVAHNGALWVGPPNGGISVIGGGKGPPSIVPPVREVIVKVTKEKYQIWVDLTHLRNIIFEDATIGYFGRSIKLESVQFIRCSFQVLARDVESRENVSRFLAAALTEKPIDLELLGQGVVLP